MFSVLEEASNGIYHKTVVAKKETTGDFEVEFKGDQPVAKGNQYEIKKKFGQKLSFFKSDFILSVCHD